VADWLIVSTISHRICAEYERFRSQALKDPEDSREMMELISYMETVKDGLVMEQWEAVQESLHTLTYLLDIHNFTTEEMELNKVTLTWPKKLSPIFDQNEEIIEASKVCV
jgi:dynein heavy chain